MQIPGYAAVRAAIAKGNAKCMGTFDAAVRDAIPKNNAEGMGKFDAADVPAVPKAMPHWMKVRLLKWRRRKDKEEKSRPMLILKVDGKTLRFRKTKYRLLPLAGLADEHY